MGSFTIEVSSPKSPLPPALMVTPAIPPSCNDKTSPTSTDTGPSTRGSNGDSLLQVVSPGGGGNADDGFKTGDRYSLADTQAHEDICGRRQGRP